MSQQTATMKDAFAYYRRGLAKTDLGDKQGAITDYNEAIRINPKYADFYIHRGIAKSELGDKQGAITDYTEAIRINPKSRSAGYALQFRGLVKLELLDIEGWRADLILGKLLLQVYGNL